MNGFSVSTRPSVLLLFVIIFHKAQCWCTNKETSQPLKFELLKKNNQSYYLTLIEGFQLEIACCIVSKTPSVSWQFNEKPINEYGDMFVLSEQGQVVQSASTALVDNSVLQGVYTCIAIDGNETLSAAFIVTRIPQSRNVCSQGKTTDVKLGHPPSSLYRIVSGSSLTLECTVLLTCHIVSDDEAIYWQKYYWNYDVNAAEQVPDEDSDNWVAAYTLFKNDPYDKTTGNYVNVTASNLNYSQVLVTTILHIANITDEDLHDVNDPDSFSYLSCDNGDQACRTNRTKNYYRCGYSGSGTVNQLQQVLRSSRTVTLFSGAPPTSLPQITVRPDNSRLQQDGVIIGSTIGAAFILISIFALLFVAYEWHLKLYIRRMLLQLRGKSSTKTGNYKYDCYVACCIKDDKFVYEVLRHQMEEQHGYRLCLPERDFSIGTAIPDEIERCIQSSEYFMAVISPGFWETEWCSLSVDLALRTNAKVVAVIDKVLGKDQRDQGNRLMTALKSPGCTSIKSGLLTRESSWEKLVLRLRYAMPRLESI